MERAKFVFHCVWMISSWLIVIGITKDLSPTYTINMAQFISFLVSAIGAIKLIVDVIFYVDTLVQD